MTAPHRSGREYETSLSADRRRRDGIHYTPASIVADLVGESFAVLGRPPRRVFDPTCGSGAFLVGALDALVDAGVQPSEALDRVRGVDIDSEAVEIARHVLGEWAESHGVAADRVPHGAVAVADALVADWPPDLDLVIGNPPFGGQLRGSTVRDGVGSDRAASILGRRSGYADTAGLFLVRAVHSVRNGGVVVLIQPMSVLGARDAGIVRRCVDALATVRDVRFPDSAVFDASVNVCAPVILRDGTGERARPWTEIAADALGLPPAPPAGSQTLSGVAVPTAGFRDEFYAVARCVAEAEPDDVRPRLVTTGAIEPGHVRWGERPATVMRRRFDRPVVDIDALRRLSVGPDGDRRMVAQIDRRLSPKVLVATQTRWLEAVVDPEGTMWPSVPVVSVLPGSIDVWSILAVLVSREATAWLSRRSLGTGLSRGALRVSARTLGDLPVPTDPAPWLEAATLLRDGERVDAPRVLEAMSRAYADRSR